MSNFAFSASVSGGAATLAEQLAHPQGGAAPLPRPTHLHDYSRQHQHNAGPVSREAAFANMFETDEASLESMAKVCFACLAGSV